jgi:hypothetical protein
MTITVKIPAMKQLSDGSLAASACRGLLLGVGTALLTCFVELFDSFVYGLADVLLGDETGERK